MRAQLNACHVLSTYQRTEANDWRILQVAERNSSGSISFQYCTAGTMMKHLQSTKEGCSQVSRRPKAQRHFLGTAWERPFQGEGSSKQEGVKSHSFYLSQPLVMDFNYILSRTVTQLLCAITAFWQHHMLGVGKCWAEIVLCFGGCWLCPQHAEVPRPETEPLTAVTMLDP